jgi:AcrR family transcriptional regulator
MTDKSYKSKMPNQTFFNLPENKREIIVKVAIEEFATKDYNSVSISRIAKESNIAKGSFYQYFQDKKDLYLYLLDLLGKTKLSFLQNNHPPKSKLDFYEYLSWLLEINMNFDLTYPTLSRLSYRAFYGVLPFQEPKIEAAKKAFSELISQMVIKGVADGDIDRDIDIELAVFVVDTLINAFSNYLPQKLGVSSSKLSREGASALDDESVKNTFNELIQILKFGLKNNV